MTDRKRKRRQLFELYSQSLAVCRSEHVGHYACPLCLDWYDESALETDPPILTLEHARPKGLGKPSFVLTCKACNNTAGHCIEHHLHSRLKFDKSWKTPGTEHDVRLKYGEGSIAAAFEKTDAGMTFRLQQKRSNPADIHSLRQALESKSFSGMKMMFPVPRMRPTHVALLKAAYLIAFHNLGYQYILSPNMDIVREQIAKPKESLLPVERLVLVPQTGKFPNELGFITSPLELSGYIVTIGIPKFDVTYGVILPTSTLTYSEWQKWAETHGKPPTLSFDEHPFDESNLLNSTNRWN